MAKEDKIILYVDDEEKNLTSFKSVFRKDYTILLASSAETGLEVIQNNPVHLVISDQRMPNITGVEFLERIAGLYPDIVRIIITGYSDFDAIVNAINRANIYQYVAKPWKKTDLKTVIDGACELFSLRQENKGLIQDLKKVNQELDKFIYSAAHDLRAPVTTLKGLINIAKQENNLHELKNILGLKERTVQKLDHFICEIHDYSVNLRSEFIFDSIDFEALIQKILKRHQPIEKYKRVQFSYTIEKDASYQTDQDRIEIILQNLIGNAFQFHNPHVETPQVKLTILAKNKQLHIEVADNGIGIKPEFMPQIFDMFFKATNQNHGSGLGLYVVKQTVEKLNGTIDVKSSPEEGTIFTVNIPLI